MKICKPVCWRIADGGLAHHVFELWQDGARDIDTATGHWRVNWPAVMAGDQLDHPAFDHLNERHDMMHYLSAIAAQLNEPDENKFSLIEDD